MKINFKYDKEKDVWCLLNKGKSSINSPNSTAVYQELVTKVGEDPNEVSTSKFIDEYLSKNNLSPDNLIKRYQEEFSKIAADFRSVAEKVFGVSLDKKLTAYLTINTRCPYDVNEGWFFVSIIKDNPTLTIMHELWHFYTWEKFGADWEAKIGEEKYNEIKEALTVLLNIECKALLPEGVEDRGYPQHQELRRKIVGLWSQNPNLDYVWKETISI